MAETDKFEKLMEALCLIALAEKQFFIGKAKSATFGSEREKNRKKPHSVEISAFNRGRKKAACSPERKPFLATELLIQREVILKHFL